MNRPRGWNLTRAQKRDYWEFKEKERKAVRKAKEARQAAARYNQWKQMLAKGKEPVQ